jgi:hypothetical protein
VRTPHPSVPNTVISPFSTPLDLATSGINGRVFYKNVLLAPTNLTNNVLWGEWGTVNVPRFFDAQIAASGDNRFLVAWSQDLETEERWLEDVYYTVVSSTGGTIKPVTQFSGDEYCIGRVLLE